jgi:LytS/YehU family sensor histidine kinase
MDVNLPIKNLVRLNWLFSVFIGTAVFFLIQLLDKHEHHPFLYTVMTVLNISLIGLINIVVLIILARRFETKSAKFKLYRYLLTYIASITAYLLIWPIFASVSKTSWSYFDMSFLFMFVFSSSLVNTLIIISQNFVILQHEKSRADKEFSRLKIAHAEAANLLLKQQIHPHFLFNALNTLKSLYRKDTDAGDTYIVHLANFLRASVFKHAAKTSRLDDEFMFLMDYLEMQTIRFGSALVCTVNIPEGSFKNCYLPSFSLQPLLENAIKHNELTEEMPLKVAIYQDSDWIVVSNNLQKKTVRESSTNNGLANLAERYRLLSGDDILINADNNLFSVSIKLLTHEYSDH